MARALLEAGIMPDAVYGTSIGAINGAAIAADPTPAGASRLIETWAELAADAVLGGSLVGRLVELVRSGTSLHDNAELRRLLCERLPVRTFEELVVPFQCVAASLERTREHWFSSGELVEAVLASCALPGVFPPVEMAGEHFLDGGLVNSIPLERAVSHGAEVVWVLHVGRLEESLTVPRSPWQVGFVAFEIARRHRFHTDLGRVPEGVRVHVLPTGFPSRKAGTWSNLRYRDPRRIAGRAESGYEATRAYLAGL